MARFTVVVVLPTPPFWLETEITLVRAGFGREIALMVLRREVDSKISLARGVLLKSAIDYPS
jgi:hypothetical protein